MQQLKKIHFFAFFAHMNPNPDAVTKIKAVLCGSGSKTVDTLIKREEIYTSGPSKLSEKFFQIFLFFSVYKLIKVTLNRA
jgi:hypothetical protein